LIRRKAQAFQALERAIELGYDDFEWMQHDPDLSGLRDHPSFQKLLAKLQPQS
jgi:hypothetical protein